MWNLNSKSSGTDLLIQGKLVGPGTGFQSWKLLDCCLFFCNQRGEEGRCLSFSGATDGVHHLWKNRLSPPWGIVSYEVKLETASIYTLFLWASLNRAQPRRGGVNTAGVLTQLAINGWGSAMHGNGSYNCAFLGLCWHLCSNTALCMQRNHWTALLLVGVFSLTWHRWCGVPF